MCCGARAWRRVVLVAGFLLMGWAAQAQDQPKQQPPDQPKYEVTGFRDARFGMTEADVRALAQSLALPMTDEDAAEVTHRLNAFIEALAPLADLPSGGPEPTPAPVDPDA